MTREIPEQMALADLVRDLSLTPQRIAIELNGQIVRQKKWAETIVSQGDRIEIVHFVGGGCGFMKKGA